MLLRTKELDIADKIQQSTSTKEVPLLVFNILIKTTRGSSSGNANTLKSSSRNVCDAAACVVRSVIQVSEQAVCEQFMWWLRCVGYHSLAKGRQCKSFK